MQFVTTLNLPDKRCLPEEPTLLCNQVESSHESRGADVRLLIGTLASVLAQVVGLSEHEHQL
jgi:hypothetical protein